MQTTDPDEVDSTCLSIAGVDVSIRGPRSVLSIVNRTMVHAMRSAATTPQPPGVEVEGDEFVWRINASSPHTAKVLSAASALPQVGGAIVSSVIAKVAESAGLCVWRAAVVERDGNAVAFVGDDWESGIVLATHLHARGWRFLGGDYALVDRKTLDIAATPKLLFITLSFMDDLPTSYKRAVEASPWYSTSRDIAFFAVDPALARSSDPWAQTGRLRAVLKLDGHVAESPSLERPGPFALSGGVSSGELESAGVAVAEIKLGDYISTCDLVERWFDAVVAD